MQPGETPEEPLEERPEEQPEEQPDEQPEGEGGEERQGTLKLGPLKIPRLQWLIQKLWWLHSFGALAFGVGVMLFARKGLDYADKVLMALGFSWLLVFVAFRFIVGAQNRRPDERMARKGIRIITNYVIKQFYQQMLFFLVPLYASSATWSLSSYNWVLVPLLLTCAVLSTMDLVFDNVIMERRILASSMYGLCMFGVLNVLLPLTFGFSHYAALLVAAAATAPTVALLTYRIRVVVSSRGLLLTFAVTLAMLTAAYFGRRAIPPAPLSMSAGAVGHGTPGEYECVPGPKRGLRSDRLDQLRCVTRLAAPGGIHEDIIHVWEHEGEMVLRADPGRMSPEDCGKDVYRSSLGQPPEDPTGSWSCTVETGDGQLIGRVAWDVRPAPGEKDAKEEEAKGEGEDGAEEEGQGADAGAASDS